VNKDIYQIFEAYNTEAVDTTAIKKKYDDGLKAITDAGFSPEQMTNAKNVLAQQWQSERQEIGADAGGQDLQELDTIFGTSDTTSPAPTKPTTPAGSELWLAWRIVFTALSMARGIVRVPKQ
jgi:hypothetical protein